MEFGLNNQIWVIDGAFGTMLQNKGMKPGQIPELLNLSDPDLIASIHKEYIDAGSQITYANTFGANRKKLEGTGHSVKEVVQAALKIAKDAAKATDTLVALDIGPIGELLEPMGTLSFEEAYDIYKEIIDAGKDQADLIVLETLADLYEAKAALLAAKENSDLPVFVTMTFEPNGRTFTGCTLESMAMTLEGLGADAIGLNCSAGPDLMEPLLVKLCSLTSLPVIAKPNAGLPDPKSGHYHMSPEQFLDCLEPCMNAGVSIVGGCCGTTPEYISLLTEKYKGKEPAKRSGIRSSGICSPQKAVPIDQVRVIGERINPTGKKRFQQALLENDLDYIVSVALDQAQVGADILDVNVGYPGVDEVQMLPAVVKAIQAVVDLPLQLDSSDPKALEAALRVYNGKPSINSVNGKKENQEAILPLAAKYGASLVGLALDEDGIPQSARKRLEIARQIQEAAHSYGIKDEDLWIDCLTLTVSAQQDQAQETLKAVHDVTHDLGLNTVLGVSNISFGLPNRPLITTAFLMAAMQEGLTLPIINPNQKEIMDIVSAYKVLSGQDPSSRAYIERFSAQQAPAQSQEKTSLTLQQAVIQGLKKEAGHLAKEELKTRQPLDLVEEDLIPALDYVGKCYESQKMFLPQLLSAATAAQQVFEVLKDEMAKTGQKSISKGKIVMATVQGDIHDIGKNIVKTVLENYGYEVIDLGKDVDPQLVVDAVREHNVKLVGLSALMTTTLPSMEKTIRLLKQMDNPPKVMVGGAVVTQDYADASGADFYCRDANDSVKAAREVYGA